MTQEMGVMPVEREPAAAPGGGAQPEQAIDLPAILDEFDGILDDHIDMVETKGDEVSNEAHYFAVAGLARQVRGARQLHADRTFPHF